MSNTYRIGIDVGGTFTHAVAIDGLSSNLVGKAKVPTSHSAPEGVARGIVESLHLLLADTGIAPDTVSFIAHSTTQATNALLEGDVVKVGVLGMSSPALAPLASAATRLGRIPLAGHGAKGVYMETAHRFLAVEAKPAGAQSDTFDASQLAEIEKLLLELKAEGCGAIAVSDAYSVDDGKREEAVLAVCRRLGLLATSGSEVSKLYGLKVRTRTAAINAGILPKMIESADMTEESVRASGIQAPIMIMRSDGGVMDIAAMRKRPILSILSGPAAGVAAAMMFLRISDGVFLEVGGTSTDISAIASGRALVRSAEIGGHKVYMRTLDVRTIGVAGGSLVRLAGGNIIDVGPRSAHIAGLKYAAFPTDAVKKSLNGESSSAASCFTVKCIRPLPKDSEDYLALSLDSASGGNGSSQQLHTLTPTCASNLLGLVPEEDCARGDLESIKAGFAALAAYLKKDGVAPAVQAELARRILTLAAAKCEPTVRALIQENKLDPELTLLVGGGGGAAAIVPFLAATMKLSHNLATHADVISAIGVAMALIRESVERQVADAASASEAILSLRADVFNSVHAMGADPATIEVHVEVDSKTNIIRATACGAAKASTDSVSRTLSDDQCKEKAAQSMRLKLEDVREVCRSSFFTVYGGTVHRQGSVFALKLPFLTSSSFALRVVDKEGIVRLSSRAGAAEMCSKEGTEDLIRRMVEEHSTWGDAGKTIPDILLLLGARVIDLSGLLNEEQVLSLARSELANLPSGSEVIVVAKF
ncbi:MAG TPA: hydantoinase/oxoprolinase family protein [Candidatus Obscuribacter sp.]|nr:hydantoinase/oxoprolinase family protein [Candidatus Obscuribacter sp.]